MRLPSIPIPLCAQLYQTLYCRLNITHRRKPSIFHRLDITGRTRGLIKELPQVDIGHEPDIPRPGFCPCSGGKAPIRYEHWTESPPLRQEIQEACAVTVKSTNHFSDHIRINVRTPEGMLTLDEADFALPHRDGVDSTITGTGGQEYPRASLFLEHRNQRLKAIPRQAPDVVPGQGVDVARPVLVPSSPQNTV